MNSCVFLAFLQAHAQAGPNGGRRANLAVFLGIRTPSCSWLLVEDFSVADKRNVMGINLNAFER